MLIKSLHDFMKRDVVAIRMKDSQGMGFTLDLVQITRFYILK